MEIPKPFFKEIIFKPEDFEAPKAKAEINGIETIIDTKVVGAFNPGVTTINEDGLEKILFMADLKGRGEVYLEDLITGLSDPSPAVRYWSAKGLSALEEKAIPACESLQSLLNDDFSIVRIAAAEALCKTGNSNDAINILGEALLEEDIVTRLYAAISILDLKSIPYHIRDKIYDSKKQEPKLIPDKHYITYLKNVLQRIEMKI